MALGPSGTHVFTASTDSTSLSTSLHFQSSQREIMALDADSEDPGRELGLITLEGTTLTVALKAASQSALIRTAFENDRMESTLPLNVSTLHLQWVIDFMVHHDTHPLPPITKPLTSTDLKENGVEPWDLEFLSRMNDNVEDIQALLKTANYLDLPSLLNLLCAKLATFIKGQSAEEIRRRFGIEDDLTPEEKEHIRNEHGWAENGEYAPEHAAHEAHAEHGAHAI